MTKYSPFILKSIDGIDLDAVIHVSERVPSKGTIIQAHGITANMDEGGMFIRLAETLATIGFNVLRFSFRGHGKSGGTQRGMTIAGEMLDLQAAIDHAKLSYQDKISVVAASFGAVSACLSLPYLEHEMKGLALWNPVLNLRRTFLNPELPWAKKSFNEQGFQDLRKRGYLLLDHTFQIGRVLCEEMNQLDPLNYFLNSSVPSMIVHGDKDTYVSYSIAKEASQKHPNCRMYTITNSDHGFDGRSNEDKAIQNTVDWLNILYTS